MLLWHRLESLCYRFKELFRPEFGNEIKDIDMETQVMDHSHIPDPSLFSPFPPKLFLDGLIALEARLNPEGQVRREVKPGNANLIVSQRKPGDYS